MPSCIYNTDGKWLAVLRNNQFKEGVNFWRKDQRKFHLPAGSHFYFRVTETRLIAGRARYIEQTSLLIEDAWRRFGTRNGVTSEEDLRNRAASVLGIEQGAKLNCLVLGEIELLDEENYIALLDAEFPAQIMSSKFFHDAEIARIDNEFSQRMPSQPAAIGNLVATMAQVGKQGLFDPDSVTTAREVSLRAIAVRRGQPEFRQKILTAYSGMCAVTGEATLAVLEAAHIVPYRGADTNVTQNGLLLRADWHTLFDLGYWWLDDQLRIVVADSLQGSEYYTHHGKTIRLPRETADCPSPQALIAHRQNIGK